MKHCDTPQGLSVPANPELLCPDFHLTIEKRKLETKGGLPQKLTRISAVHLGKGRETRLGQPFGDERAQVRIDLHSMNNAKAIRPAGARQRERPKPLKSSSLENMQGFHKAHGREEPIQDLDLC